MHFPIEKAHKNGKKRPKNRIFLAFLTVLFVCFTSFHSYAADNDGNVDLENLETEIKSGQAKTQALEKTAEQIQAERSQLNKQIKVAAKQIQQSEAYLSAGEKKLETLGANEDILRAQFNKRKQILARLLAALLKLEKNPPPALLTKPDDASNALRSAIILGRIVPEVKKQSDVIAVNLASLSEIRHDLTVQQNELIANTKELRKQRNYIAKLLEQKTALSSKTQDEIRAEQQKMAALGQKAKNIRDLFNRIEAQKKLELELTAKNVAALEAKRKANLEQKQRQLAAAQKAANSQEIQQIKNSITQLKKPPFRQARVLASFNNFKNKLPHPAQGYLLRNYGEKDSQGREAKGITISTRSYAQITSPASGTVLFADEFNNYGYLVIIDVGQKYSILLTGLGQIAVTTNQFIETGDPIGIMPKNAINGGDNANAAPIIYIEFRRNNNSINSAPWWQTKLAKR